MRTLLFIAGLACLAGAVYGFTTRAFGDVFAEALLSSGTAVLILGSLYTSRYYRRGKLRIHRTPRSKSAWRQLSLLFLALAGLAGVPTTILFLWLLQRMGLTLDLATLAPVGIFLVVAIAFGLMGHEPPPTYDV